MKKKISKARKQLKPTTEKEWEKVERKMMWKPAPMQERIKLAKKMAARARSRLAQVTPAELARSADEFSRVLDNIDSDPLAGTILQEQ